MKTLALIFISLCLLGSTRFIYPQRELLQPAKKQTLLKQKQSPLNMWDILLLDNATSITGAGGNAGAVYLPAVDEIWTSRWGSSSLFRWTSDGHLNAFTIQGLSGVRAMTFDGNYVYAVDNTTTIYKIDPLSYSLVGTITSPQIARYITFDPTAAQGQGGFWVGNYSTNPQLISYNGSVLKTLNYSDLGTTTIYGAAFDNYSPNGPFIWFFGQTDGYYSPQVLSQVSLQTGKSTSVQFDVGQDLSTYSDSSLAGGLFVANGYVAGKVMLGGILQGTPDILFGYEIADAGVTPITISIDKTFTFDDIKLSSSYRMLGFPGNISLPVSQCVSNAGEQKVNWNVYYDNGQNANYLVEYNHSNDFVFRPGNGFWILSKNPLNIATQVNTVTITNNQYSIPLHSGWNIISNPFDINVNWNSVITANGLPNNSLIYAWNGSWSNPQVFERYEGYYFNNVTNLNSLSIPFTPALGKNAAMNHYSLEKYIKIDLISDCAQTSTAFASIKSRSSNDFDDYDFFTPPSDFSMLNVYIHNGDLKTSYKNLFIDSRPDIGEGQIFSLKLKNNTGQDAILRFSGLENFGEYEICLNDARLRRLYNLKELQEIRLIPYPAERELQLLIGIKSFIEKNSAQAPSEFALYQNYPNPFNPATIISYDVPRMSTVEIKVFDLLGKEVKTLVHGEQAPGRYEVRFEGNNLGSGAYIYTIKAGSYFKSHKMMLIK